VVAEVVEDGFEVRPRSCCTALGEPPGEAPVVVDDGGCFGLVEYGGDRVQLRVAVRPQSNS
jgi:hypothetical protein